LFVVSPLQHARIFCKVESTRVRILQLYLIAVFSIVAASSELDAIGSDQIHILNLVDVDGNKLSTSDSYRTVLILTPTSDVNKARLVGDRIPEYCLGNPAYRMITVITFKKNPPRFVRTWLKAAIRRRLDAEAKRLRPRYLARKLLQDPRKDVHAVADFSGQIRATLGKTAETFSVLVFSSNGELLREWNDEPNASALVAAL